MKTSISSILTITALAAQISILHAADSATGNWLWTAPGRNGAPDRVNTLKLKADGPRLTGQLSVPGRDGKAVESPITEGKIDGNAISFAVVREFNGNLNTNRYSAKVAGDKLTGKIEFTREGQTQSRDWEAKREGSTPAPSAQLAPLPGSLSPTAAAAFLAKHSDAVALDVRSGRDYAAGHLPHAKNIDFLATDFKEQVTELDKSKPIVVYCTRGLNKTVKTVELLNTLGATNVLFVAGGYNAWESAGQTIQK